jgi:DNA-directed RNA polymerase subunit RPC12/RpoP/uncharacterized membrane protein YagU involved in acid resistance
MAVDLVCPSCGTTASISETNAERDVICAQCRRRFHDPARPAERAAAGVVISCPSCARKYVIAESHLGRNIVCLWCQHRFRIVPAGEDEPAQSDEDAVLDIACPSCGYQRAGTAAYVNQAVGCPRCKALFVVKTPPTSVEVPRPTAWPIVLSLGIALVGFSAATNLTFALVGLAVALFGLAGWIHQLLPGQGHTHEPLVDASLRPQPVPERLGTVDQLRPGLPGYRFRLPEKVHPISSGVKGGIIGGLVMPIPTLIYGFQSGNGPWLPINLLAGMALPGIEEMSLPQLREFNLTYTIVAVIIHAVFSVGFGLLYGVVLPTMPKIPGGPLIWGGLLMPLVWTGASYASMGVVNPALRDHVDWRWFLLSQFVYGIVMAWVVFRTEKVHVPPTGGPGELVW